MRRGAAWGWVLSAALLTSGHVSAQSTLELQQSTGASGSDQSVAAETAVRAPVLSAQALAMRAVLEPKLGASSSAFAAYSARGFKPIWLNDDGTASQRAKDLTAILARAGRHALPVAKYKGAALAARLSEVGPRLEADLTAAYLDYASDLSSGFLKPRRIDRELHIDPKSVDHGILIQRAYDARDMAAHLEALAPQDPAYNRLVERYAAFRSIAGEEIWGPSIRRGKTLRVGNRGARVGDIRARLTAMGDLDPNVYDVQQAGVAADGTQLATAGGQTDLPVTAFDPNVFDEPMVEAIRRFQARHGLNTDGAIGPATLRQLNISPRQRAEQIAVNLERMRWMNKELGKRHILVNLAGFTMAVINDGRIEFESRVVGGKAKEHRTPEFSDEMEYMVINPRWNVPRSIATKEILPRLQSDPGYLQRRNMRLVGADASTVDWTTVTPSTFPGRIVQNPGRSNALGKVKFMFPNNFAIYLHDTPSKRLFNRDVRAYSHGCVRVEKPYELAAYLLKDQKEDPAGFFQRMLKSGKERHVRLDTPLPIHLTYRSAWIDDAGVEQFRGDIYKRDRKIAKAMTNAGVAILQ